MAQHLTNVEITEISLVDEPANEDARVVIVKAKSGSADDGGAKKSVPMAKIAGAVIAAIEEMTPQIVKKAMAEGFSADPEAADAATAIVKETVMDMEAVTKALEEAEAKLDALEKRATEAEAEIKAKDDIIKAKDEEIAKAKAKHSEPDGDEGEDEDEEEVMKSLPASIRKRLEEAEAARVELAKAKETAEKAEAIAKAKALGVGDAEKVGELLLRVSKGKTTEADVAEIEGILKSAGKIMEQSPLFKSLGASGDADADPEAILKAKAEEIIAKSGGGMTFAQAYDRALSENPEVYNAFIAKRR